MKFTSQFLVVASAVCLLACSQENNNTTTETASADDISSATAPATTPDTTVDAMQQMAEMAVGGKQPATTPVAAGMNPPHGQPGHRCDIEVGAPLNSAPNVSATANNANPAMNATPPANNTSSPVFTAPATQPTAAGMNPPHGQPGHDCAIPVGAPLKK